MKTRRKQQEEVIKVDSELSAALSKKPLAWEDTQIDDKRWFYPDKSGYTNTSFIQEWIKTSILDAENVYELIVGTDSHLHGHYFRFVTVIALYKVGKGGMYYYTISYEPRTKYKGNQQARMFHEVSLSTSLAEHLLNNTGVKATIDIDASPKSAGQFTSSFSDSLTGFVTSMGFAARIKPMGPIASAVADRHTK